MTTERLFLIALLIGGVLLFQQWGGRPIEHPPGVLVPFDPVQQPVAETEFVKGDYLLRQRARFDIRARVLSRRDYSLDVGAELAPIDLALGWGPMSDQSLLDQMEISQSSRWYRLRWDGPLPVSDQVVMGHSGNMHLIPANDAVLDQLKDVREGQVVRLWGYLVDASRPDGFTWTTSLSRDDVGGGSCELFYVEAVVLEPAPS